MTVTTTGEIRRVALYVSQKQYAGINNGQPGMRMVEELATMGLGAAATVCVCQVNSTIEGHPTGMHKGRVGRRGSSSGSGVKV